MTKMRDVWKVWDTPELGKTYRDVYMTGKLYKCIEIKPVDYSPFHDYIMEEVKTGNRGTYQAEGWKLVEPRAKKNTV